MYDRTSAFGLVALAGVALGCSSAAGSDPSLWDQSHDLGGKSLAPASGGSGATPGAGGAAGGQGFGGAAGDNGFGGTGAGGTGAGGTGAGGTGAGGTGAGGTGAGGTGAGGGTNSGACSFTFDFTTIPGGGTYSPRNIEAAWIAAPGNAFVKSLEVHAKTRIVHLLNWNKASGGNKVDAVTSATLSKHGPHHVTWDCTDLNHQPVPDGTYRIYFEFTESDSAFIVYPQPKLGSVDFQKGQAQDFAPPDQQFFKSMHLVIQ